MVTKQKPRFKIGDFIVHTSYGVGKVENIVEKELDDNRQDYYKISTNEIEYWLPLDKQDSEHIEPIRSRHAFENAIKILSMTPEISDLARNARINMIHDRWQDGSLEGRASLFRDLNGQNVLGKLNYNEKQMLNKIRRFFIREWILADHSLTQIQADEKVNKALLIGVKSLQHANAENI